MNILIITNYFPPEIGAAANRIFMLARSLKNSGNQVSIVCPFPNYPLGKVYAGYNGLYKFEAIEELKVHRFYIKPSNSKNILLRAISMFSFAISLWLMGIKDKSNYNLIIVQNSPLLVSFSAIILYKKLLKNKLILNVSDLWPISGIDLGVLKKGSFTNILTKIELFNYNSSDLIVGQSKAILNHIDSLVKKPTFLYRNIQDFKPNLKEKKKKNKKVRFIYSGLLGVAQGVYKILLELIKNNSKDFQIDIYGDGNEKNLILDLIDTNQKNNIKYKGSVLKEILHESLPMYDFAIVPLAKHIRGAFPSKIYELILFNIPIIFIGSGEPKKFIDENRLGYSIFPENLIELNNVVDKCISLSNYKYEKLVNNCIRVSRDQLNYSDQFKNFKSKINEI